VTSDGGDDRRDRGRGPIPARNWTQRSLPAGVILYFCNEAELSWSSCWFSVLLRLSWLRWLIFFNDRACTAAFALLIESCWCRPSGGYLVPLVAIFAMLDRARSETSSGEVERALSHHATTRYPERSAIADARDVRRRMCGQRARRPLPSPPFRLASTSSAVVREYEIPPTRADTAGLRSKSKCCGASPIVEENQPVGARINASRTETSKTTRTALPRCKIKYDTGRNDHLRPVARTG